MSFSVRSAGSSAISNRQVLPARWNCQATVRCTCVAWGGGIAMCCLPREIRSADQACVERNVRAGERARNRTILLGAVGLFLERGFLDAGDFGFRLQFDARDLETGVGFLERRFRGGVHALGW